MKKKYIYLLLLIIFFSFEKVNAYTNYENYNSTKDSGVDLIYSIDYVNVSTNNIVFKGWAYVDEVNTIGGHNTFISIKAVRLSDFQNSSADTLINDYSSNIIKKEALYKTDYNGGNSLYPTTCYRIGGLCQQVYYGFYDTTKPRATCDGSGSTSCIHYNPYFELSFSKNELYNKFGTDEIIFIISIRYKKVNINSEGSTSGCRWDGSKYVGCERTTDKNASRVLAFHESVLNVTSEKEIDTFNIVDIKTNTYFKMVANFIRLDGIEYNKYFEYLNGNNEFKIGDTEVRENVWNSELKVYNSIRWYSLYIKNDTTYRSDGINKYYSPGTARTKKAPSTAGIVDGIVVMRYNKGAEPPNDNCGSEITDDGKCRDAIYEASCNKKISSQVYQSQDLNSSSCRSATLSTNPAEITVYKVYDMTEKTIVYRDNLFDQSLGKVWPGIKWNQKIKWHVTREVSWSAQPEYYYYVKRRYDSDPGTGVSCEWESGWVSQSYLLGKGNAGITYFVNTLSGNQIESKADLFAEGKWLGDGTYENAYYARSVNKKNERLRLGFPNSSKYSDPQYKGGANLINIINVVSSIYNTDKISNKFNAEEKFEIKNAWIKDTDVKYSNNNPGDYYDGENYYYFAFDVPVGEVIKFGWGVDYKSIIKKVDSSIDIEDEKIRVWCPLTVEEGNLESMNYRVIDLSNPFPNTPPDLTANKAVNWYGIWTSPSTNGFGSGGNKNYLYERTKKPNVEIYTANLTPENIEEVRKHNESEISYNRTYINAFLDKDGNSDFIINFDADFNMFDYENISISEVGKEGVE